VHDDPPRLVKRGDPAALAREAGALRMLAGTGLAPTISASAADEITVARVPGRPMALDTLSGAKLRELGATLRRVHQTRRHASGGRHVWRSPARSLHAYARRRLADIALPDGLGPLAATIGSAFTDIRTNDPQPFRLLHGDLVQENIVWSPRPVLVDWEFWRTGDPAEDLAYLFVLNDLTAKNERAILAGYGEPTMATRVRPWRALCALDAGVWYQREGCADLGDELLRRAHALVASG
jgi:aminoglycoside phosphotransferase (APT) family kinase protein